MSAISVTYQSLVDDQVSPFRNPHLIDPEDICECAGDPEEGFVPFGVTILTGDPGCGKTAFATAIALAVAAGEPFAGQPQRQGPVFWFAAEEDVIDRNRLLAYRYARNSKVTEPLPFQTFHGNIHLQEPETLREFLNCFTTGSNFCVLDPLAAFVKNPAEYRDLILALKRIGLDHGVTFLLPHWSRASNLAGGPAVQSAASAVWRLSSKAQEGKRLVRLDMSGRAQPPRTLRFISEHPLHYELVEVATRSEKLTAEEAITRALGKKPKTPEQLSGETGCNLKSVRNTVTKLVSEGVAKVAGKEGRTTAYAIA